MDHTDKREEDVRNITNSEEENDNFVIDLLRQQVNDKVTVDIEQPKEESTENIIKNANNKFLLDVLSPEIKKNEEKKRQHKDTLMRSMKTFLIFQFLIVAIMVLYSGYWIIHLQVIEKPFSDSTIKIIFAFIGTYITSVIVELIAILRYIVKNVFDTSIAGMVNNFKDDKK